MNALRVLAFVLAGGEGRRLLPFTERCPKPALPFGGGYRLIDFVLSNLYNSGIPRVAVLLHYRPQLLEGHLAECWGRLDGARGSFLRLLTPQSAGAPEFSGTADAVARTLHAVEATHVDVIAVFASDHVYRMDVRQMVAFHQGRAADATVAAVPVPRAHARAFGVICADADGRIGGFQEKPAQPEAMPGDPARALASMGNYLFRPEVLQAALADALARGEHDFGRHVLPRLVERHRVYAYDFARNVVPGVHAAEEPAYWRDVGSVDTYVEAHWDLLGPQPRFRLDNLEWPIRCGGAPRVLGSLDGGDVTHSIIGPGVQYQGALLRHCVLQRGAQVAPGAELERCIVMEGARIERGVRLREAIVGGGNTLARTKRLKVRPSAQRAVLGRSSAGMMIVAPRAGEEPRARTIA